MYTGTDTGIHRCRLVRVVITRGHSNSKLVVSAVIVVVESGCE